MNKQKFYGSFLWIGLNSLKAREPLRTESLLFTTKYQKFLELI